MCIGVYRVLNSVFNFFPRLAFLINLRDFVSAILYLSPVPYSVSFSFGQVSVHMHSHLPLEVTGAVPVR